MHTSAGKEKEKKWRFQRILNAQIQFIDIFMNKTQLMAKNSFPSLFLFHVTPFFSHTATVYVLHMQTSLTKEGTLNQTLIRKSINLGFHSDNAV